MKKVLSIPGLGLGLGLVCLGILVLPTGIVRAQSAGTIVAWGENGGGQCDVPAPNADFVAVAAGLYHSLGLKSDGRIMVWGFQASSQMKVPAPNAGFVAIAAGYDHNLGLKSDGTVVAWGWNYAGQCNVPWPPPYFVAIGAGSEHSLGVTSNGSVVAWGFNEDGQCNVPSPNSGFVAVTGGTFHSLGLKSNGTVVAWGSNHTGQCNVPSPNSGFVAVAANDLSSLGLKSDGTIIAWGHGSYVPSPNASFVAVAGAKESFLALKSDGTIVAWGDDYFGQCDVPLPNSGFVAIASGGYNSLGIKASISPCECPGVVTVPAFSTRSTMVLQGFKTRNVSSGVLSFDYHLTAQGPATLVDNGNPASLSGTTPVLGPFSSYSPPQAALEIPEIREYSQELVTYHVSMTGQSGTVDSCTTIVTFEPPVAVLVSAFHATASEGGVDLSWEVASDDEVAGFKVYRSVEGGVASDDITSGGLIAADARAFRDEGVTGGCTYEYALAVVLADRSEVMSQTVTVKTKAYALALHQNTPNPFNPATTISFTLAERARVTLSIYDVQGRLVRMLVDEVLGDGYQERIWDGKDANGSQVGSGVYFYRLTAGDRTLTKKMVMLR